MTQVVPETTPGVSFEGGAHSVPHTLVGEDGVGPDRLVQLRQEVVIVHVGKERPVEVTHHARATPRSSRILDEHFPPLSTEALARVPEAKNAEEAAFLRIEDGARFWLAEATAAGTGNIRLKMSRVVALAALFGRSEVDWALGHAAVDARFAEGDPPSILDHHARRPSVGEHRASEDASLAKCTTTGGPASAPTRGRQPDDYRTHRRDTDTVRATTARRPRSPAAATTVNAHIRTHAPGILATAKAQRWDPTEVLKAVLVEEATGRERTALATRRAAAAFPTGTTFEAWVPELSSVPAPTQQALRTLEWGTCHRNKGPRRISVGGYGVSGGLRV